MQIQNYGLTLAIAIVLSIALTATLYRKDWEKHLSFWALALPLGLFGSRLLYLVPNFKYYFEEVSYPLATLFFWDGGLSLFGAILGIICALYLFFKRNCMENKIAFQNVLFSSVWLFIAGLRLAEGFTNMGLGRPFPADTNSFFVLVNGSFGRLAVYRIEVVFALLLLVICIFFHKNLEKKVQSYPYIAWFSLLILAASQMVFVSLRNDEHMIMGFVYLQQVLFAFFAIYLLYYFRGKLPKEKRLSGWLFHSIVLILAAIAFAMEFVVDGRLHFPINLFGISPDWRNYLIISLVSLGFISLGGQMLKNLYNQEK